MSPSRTALLTLAILATLAGCGDAQPDGAAAPAAPVVHIKAAGMVQKLGIT